MTVTRVLLLWAIALAVPAAHAQKFTYRDAEYNHEVELTPNRIIVRERSISGLRGDLSCPLGSGVQVHGGDGRDVVCVAFERDRCSYARVQGTTRFHDEEWAKAQAAGTRTLQHCVEMAVEDANRIAALANLRARSTIPLVDPRAAPAVVAAAPVSAPPPAPRTPQLPAGFRYEGEHRDGVPHGRGVMVWPNGDRFAGEFVGGSRHGRGSYEFKSTGVKYDGEWRNDQATGRGVMVWPNGDRYEGEFVNGVLSGFGEMRYADGGRYRGNWRDGQHNGEGVMVWKNGQQYSGQWQNGERHGRGTQRYTPLQSYEGEWRNDRRLP